MNDEAIAQKVHRCSRLVKWGLIGSVASFGAVIVVVSLPLARSVKGVLAGVGLLVMLLSFLVLVAAILARDIPTWRRNRWRFSLGTLLSIMAGIAAAFGSIVAIARRASLGQMLLAFCVYFVLTTILSWIYLSWSRSRHFKSMKSLGRYSEWSTVASHATQGEGTFLLGSCFGVPTVWWSERKFNALDDARAAIDSDAVITLCPRQRRVAQWLKRTFPTVAVFELDARGGEFVGTSQPPTDN